MPLDLEDRVPLIKQINFDYDLATVGTFVMTLKSLLLRSLIPNKDLADPTKVTWLKFLDQAFRAARQAVHYTIHARPDDVARPADDIVSDRIHNLEAYALGRSVYHYNAFVGPWLMLLRSILPYNNSLIVGLPGRVLDFADNAIGKITNLFWNLRRISSSLVAYDGGVLSSTLARKQADVRDITSFYLTKFLGPFRRVRDWLLGVDHLDVYGNQVSEYSKNRIQKLVTQIRLDYYETLRAVLTGKYRCMQEGGLPRELGSQEPQNQPWYVRLKLLSKSLGFPVGILSSILNSTGIGLNFVGALFNQRTIRSISDRCSDYASALMSLLYMTGEVPANINAFIQKKSNGVSEYGHLLVAGIGALGMLNRIKILPVFKSILNFIGVKGFLDKFDKQLQDFFLLFFSYNRLIIHKHEKIQESKRASVRDLVSAEKHNNLWSHISLPFRIMMQDKEVCYLNDQIDPQRQARIATSPVMVARDPHPVQNPARTQSSPAMAA